MVEIINYEKSDKEKVKGYVDIRVPIVKPTILIIRRIAHINNGTKKWFSMPSFARGPKTDKQKYERYFEFETPVFNNHLLDALHDKTREYCELHGISESNIDFAGFADEEPQGVIPF